ncbi:MAG: SpoIIE family protein phosphatase [Actinomycetota bacterium]|nr:SpoIIE family protein phosphatase [Actinomycetota bacterium]
MNDRADQGGADLTQRLALCRQAVDQLHAEREGLERLLLRLPALCAELEPAALRRGVVEAAVEMSQARLGFFVSSDPPHELSALVGIVPDELAEPPRPGHSPLLAAVLYGGRVLRIDDVSNWARDEQAAHVYGSLADGRLLRSWLAAPVQRRDGSNLGALYLGHPRAHAFTPRHESLIPVLCDQLGVTLENAELFAERSRVASAMQRTLLPPLLPDIVGVDLATAYRPAGAGSLVGGDFYDVFELGEGAWGLVVGDVSGFGPEAAALTGLARYTVRAVASQVSSPAEVLRRLNDAMRRVEPSERFCTAAYCRIIPANLGVDITLASAGHPPALVLRDDESVEELPTGGLMLGVFADVSLVDHHVRLNPGDALVLYTDGTFEARDRAGEQFGSERLTALLGTCAGRSASGIARRLELAVLDHRGEVTADDLAIVVVRCRS